MNREFDMLEMNKIIDMLKEHSLTEQAKNKFDALRPSLDIRELKVWLGETSEARRILDQIGTPPLMQVKDILKMAEGAGRGEMLSIEELEAMRQFASSCQRLKRFLERCSDVGSGLSGYGAGIDGLDLIEEEITVSIRGSQIDDGASKELKDIRKKLGTTANNIRLRLESILKGKKEYFSESFISNRNGHFTLPVKKEYKLQVSGSVIDVSSTGATYFIEPSSVAKLKEELGNLKIDESNEERKILYTLSDLVAGYEREIRQNLEYIETLDYIFAKGKLSQQMDAVEASVDTARHLKIVKGRHPLLKKEECVPIDISLGDDVRGIVITGPNTGGKTVALKTVGLFSLMVQCGLHIPCDSGQFGMCSQVLCDIGDGQSISENLSTFSSHIKNVIGMVGKLNRECLVLMDELGSGTDPAEGMGIAVAILEELRKSGCMFVVTTHYPEVKDYAARTEGLINARMAFDKESLRPLYRLEIGEAGESCALYIARQLGMPRHMLLKAYEAAYPHGENAGGELKSQRGKADRNVLEQAGEPEPVKANDIPAIAKEQKEIPVIPPRAQKFSLGDCVIVYPDQVLGIIYQLSDAKGMLGVQIQKKKRLINYKRLKLKAAATELYPEDYDFSIIFDSVEVRKARHVMSKRHDPGLVIKLE